MIKKSHNFDGYGVGNLQAMKEQANSPSAKYQKGSKKMNKNMHFMA